MIAIPSRLDPGVIAGELFEARARTFLLTAPLTDEELRAQHDPLMSPILWDLGHIAHFEELWLTRNLDGPIEFVEMPGLFNPFEHPRSERGALPLPVMAHCREIMDEIRGRVLGRLAITQFDSSNPLLRDGYVYRMVLQHEYQHNETILQTLQLKLGEPYHPPVRRPVPEIVVDQSGLPDMIEIPGGDYTIGTDDRNAAYDNERPRHAVTVQPFRIERTPVTNGAYLEFINAGGYRDTRLWSDTGRKWLSESQASAPAYWQRDGDAWVARTMDRTGAVDPRRPVCHVSYHEAEAFAKWAGKRLPTETEWEVAASVNGGGTALTYPWGDEPPTFAHANVDQLSFDIAVVDAYPGNVSPSGCYGMIGDVWEWTSSDFRGYPGFESFPYREYSEAWFGDEYKVLRGGSWATRPGAIRNTFRNWDYPIRRQIFSGFRCAADV